MAVMKMKVSLKDREPVTVDITPRVIIDAEEHFGTSMVQMFQDLSMKRISWLAWKAMVTGGYEVKTFEPFVNDLLEVPEVVSKEDDAPLSEA